jgi:hypothetical protein
VIGPTSGKPLVKWFVLAGACILVICVVSVAALYILKPTLHRLALQRAERYLQSRFNSSVQFADFHVSLFPRVHLIIEGLVMRHQGRTDVPPLIEIRRVTVDASPEAFWHQREVSRVSLEGLQIHTPPRVPGGPPMIHGTNVDLAKKYRFVIDEIDADNALLVLLRKPADAGIPPNQFAMHEVVLYGFSFDHPASFHGLLTNPKPTGEIHCDGQFGPWNAEQPSETPVSGDYTFQNADLSTFRGIQGTLSSEGKFSGPLDYLNVQGVTDTPDFALRTSAHPMALHTDFDAIVDGTNGNTVLTNVTAKFLHTVLKARGAVVDVFPTVKGRTILMDAVSTHARVDDLLALAVKSDQPVMTGSARMKIRILIPERDEDLVNRLQLDGEFGLGDVQFTNPATQGKVDMLSRRGQGKPNKMSIADQASDFQGKFTMLEAQAKFSNLEFNVEGAGVALNGTYNLDSGQLDFRGRLQMDAKLSKTMTGWKSAMLKPFDHFFKSADGGSDIPIKIAGTRESPVFATDFHDKENPKREAEKAPASRAN